MSILTVTVNFTATQCCSLSWCYSSDYVTVARTVILTVAHTITLAVAVFVALSGTLTIALTVILTLTSIAFILADALMVFLTITYHCYS